MNIQIIWMKNWAMAEGDIFIYYNFFISSLKYIVWFEILHTHISFMALYGAFLLDTLW